MRFGSSFLSALQAASVSGTVHRSYHYSGLRKVNSFKWERPFPTTTRRR